MKNAYTFHSSFSLESIIQNTIRSELNKGNNMGRLDVSAGIILQIPNIKSKSHNHKNLWQITRRCLEKLKNTINFEKLANELKKIWYR
ncbi:hypothetical protein MACJ_003419 [Theileria orientalis]|uniref:Uncharacterized protein n=1 Tax=Theileria orientalis TaxID=68886 RepID=A0A976SKC0_THEOR|nr:hypothetical protein MACJ_003419 [Theileria orientalis]